jgi:hypothetical protein
LSEDLPDAVHRRRDDRGFLGGAAERDNRQVSAARMEANVDLELSAGTSADERLRSSARRWSGPSGPWLESRFSAGRPRDLEAVAELEALLEERESRKNPGA